MGIVEPQVPEALVAQLDSRGILYVRKAPLKNYTYWRIGGPAELLVEPTDTQQLQDVLRLSEDFNTPYAVIGDGTNVLAKDEGFRGVVIRIGRRLSFVEKAGAPDPVTGSQAFRIGAGIWVPYVAHVLGRSGYTGIEHTIGIPGTFGGLVFMNAGSMRQGIGSVVESVLVVDSQQPSKSVLTYTKPECEFGYRASRFQQSREIITEATIRLTPGPREAILSTMHHILTDRRKKFPRKMPSCGSVFVSDPELYKAFGPPGKVIERLGLKGLRSGDAMVSQRHSNFIVNVANATYGDVMCLVKRIEEEVEQATGFRLKREFRILDVR